MKTEIVVKKLMPGRAIIRLDPMYCEQEGGIIMPETVRALRNFTGTIEQLTPETFTHKCRNCCWLQSHRGRCIKCGGKTRVMPSPSYDGYSQTLIGKRVLVEGNSIHILDKARCIIAVSDISGIFSSDAEAVKVEMGNTIPRCQLCGPAKSGTMNGTLMVHSSRGYYCPRCNRYQNGDRYVDPVTQAQKEAGMV